jgi:hypothetical protein
MFSSGAASWAAAKRVVERHGADGVVMLFADVKGSNPSPHAGEDEDNYRFAQEASANVGAPLVVVNEGRDIWDVYEDEHMLGNSRVAPCSKQLKQLPCRSWLEANCDPLTTSVYVGLAVWEEDRVAGVESGWAPWRTGFPLMDAPAMGKREIHHWLRVEGLRPPRLYAMGFNHANCGGFCCRMGLAQAATLLRTFPERYAYHEAREQAFRERWGRDVSFLRDRRDLTTTPLTLAAFRQRVELQPELPLPDDEPGCDACFTRPDAALEDSPRD